MRPSAVDRLTPRRHGRRIDREGGTLIAIAAAEDCAARTLWSPRPRERMLRSRGERCLTPLTGSRTLLHEVLGTAEATTGKAGRYEPVMPFANRRPARLQP